MHKTAENLMQVVEMRLRFKLLNTEHERLHAIWRDLRQNANKTQLVPSHDVDNSILFIVGLGLTIVYYSSPERTA